MNIDTEYLELWQTLEHLKTREDKDEIFNILNIVANLLHETGEDRVSYASYERILRHKKLKITLEYNKNERWVL